MYPFPIHIYFEIAAFLASLIFWNKLKDTKLRWFAGYLFLIIVVEVLGWYLPGYLHKKNGWLFNVSVPIEYLFFSFIFLIHFLKVINRKIVLAFVTVFIPYFFYYSFFKGINTFNANYLLYGSLAMIIFSILYFIEQYNKVSAANIWTEPMFWVVTGVFLFNAGEFSYNFLSKFIIKNKLDTTIVLFKSINNKLIILFYLLITVGFVCQKITKQFKTA
jgi:hypothetical protein